MLPGFWTGIGGKLVDSWFATVLTPTFVFWAVGVAGWARHREGAWSDGVDGLADDVRDLSAAEQGAVVIVALVILAASSVLVRSAAPAVIRALEGYWPSWLGAVRRVRTERWVRRSEADGVRWRELILQRQTATLSATEQTELSELDYRRSRTPPVRDLMMPTQLGNMLRAAEARPGTRYGLDAIICWPRLWLVLPEDARSEVSGSRRVLDQWAETWTWSVLSIVWTPFVWWLPALSVAVALVSYRRMTRSAGIYGDLVNACYDLHRFALYEATRWPAPISPHGEAEHGAGLTAFLHRGAAPISIEYDRRDDA